MEPPTYPTRLVRPELRAIASGFVPMHRDPCQPPREPCHYLGIHANASGSVPNASGSMLMPRDPRMLHRDPHYRLLIRARYRDLRAVLSPVRAATVTRSAKAEPGSLQGHPPARYSKNRA